MLFFLNYEFHICILNIYAKVYITYHYVGELCEENA